MTAMTHDDIRAAVATSPELQALAAAGDHAGIARALSGSRKVLAPTEVGKGDILMALGLDVGNALLDLIDTGAEFRHVRHFLAEGRLRADLPLTMQLVQSLVGQQIAEGVTFSAEHAATLRALAEVDDVVTHEAVTAALRGAE